MHLSVQRSIVHRSVSVQQSIDSSINASVSTTINRFINECVSQPGNCLQGKEEPLHDLFEDKEFVVPAPANGSPEKPPAILTTEVDGHQPGSDVKNGHVTQDGDQNGGTYVSFSTAEEDGDAPPHAEEEKGKEKGEGESVDAVGADQSEDSTREEK